MQHSFLYLSAVRCVLLLMEKHLPMQKFGSAIALLRGDFKIILSGGRLKKFVHHCRRASLQELGYNYVLQNRTMQIHQTPNGVETKVYADGDDDNTVHSAEKATSASSVFFMCRIPL